MESAFYTYERGIFLEKEVKIQENKMGVMPVGRLLLTMSVPMMISMLVQALYNIVDSMFVAKLSESALTAVSLAFPVQNLMIAVGTGTRRWYQCTGIQGTWGEEK